MAVSYNDDLTAKLRLKNNRDLIAMSYLSYSGYNIPDFGYKNAVP